VSTLTYSLFVIGAGISVALQQILNANLRVQLQSPWWAGFISYFVGMVAMLAVATVMPGPRLSLSTIQASPGAWVAWTGGIFGAIFIITAILMVPRLGAAMVLTLIVVGQMVGSLAFDHFGAFGVPIHPRKDGYRKGRSMATNKSRPCGVAAIVFALVVAGLFANVAVACKNRLPADAFPVDELANYTNVYVVHVEKVVPNRPLAESWYAPPFTFEARILKSLKGPKKRGAIIKGETSWGDEPAARCPIFLTAGSDYLLMLNGQDSAFILPRYGSPYLSSDDKHFRKYVAEIAHFYGARYKH